MRLNRAFACGRYSFRAFINAQNFSWISRILVVLLRFMKIVIYVRLVVTRSARAHYSPNERLNRCRTYMRTTKANKMQDSEKVKEIAWHGQQGQEQEKNKIKRQERYQMNSLTYNKKIPIRIRIHIICNLFLESYRVRVNGLFSIIWTSPLIARALEFAVLLSQLLLLLSMPFILITEHTDSLTHRQMLYDNS